MEIVTSDAQQYESGDKNEDFQRGLIRRKLIP